MKYFTYLRSPMIDEIAWCARIQILVYPQNSCFIFVKLLSYNSDSEFELTSCEM